MPPTPPPYRIEALAALDGQPIPPATKGFTAPGCTAPRTPAAIVAAGGTLFDGAFSFPLLAVRQAAVEHNVALMARFCDDMGVRLAPHAKTAMAPRLFARQLDAGAWGLTAATVEQVRVYREFGVGRVLLANELVDPAGIDWVRRELAADPEFSFLCYVDSPEGVALLAHQVDGPAPVRPLEVLVELGHRDGRTGCRTRAQARAVAECVAATPGLRLAGVGGYEGSIGGDRTPEVLAAVDGFCAELVALLRELRSGGLLADPRPILTAGGSAFPDVVARAFGPLREEATPILRSGSYVVHDEGMYERVTPFAGELRPALRPALRLWARVLSRPEPELALLGLGRRDVGFDHDLPVPREVRTRSGAPSGTGGLTVTGLNDHHCFLRTPPDHPLAPGDLVGLGISHPCTTLDRWRYAPMVDETGRVTEIIQTFF
jgi:D-serine deaminase-like pyridoxal phosphate-dependent protein